MHSKKTSMMEGMMKGARCTNTRKSQAPAALSPPSSQHTTRKQKQTQLSTTVANVRFHTNRLKQRRLQRQECRHHPKQLQPHVRVPAPTQTHPGPGEQKEASYESHSYLYNREYENVALAPVNESWEGQRRCTSSDTRAGTPTTETSTETCENHDQLHLQTHHPDSHLRRQVVGAVVVGGVAGFVLGGPGLCLLGAGGAAALATSNHRAGRIARDTGELVFESMECLQTCESEYHLTQKAWNSATESYVYVAHRLHRAPTATAAVEEKQQQQPPS